MLVDNDLFVITHRETPKKFNNYFKVMLKANKEKKFFFRYKNRIFIAVNIKNNKIFYKEFKFKL
jgi:hypothetical protein